MRHLVIGDVGGHLDVLVELLGRVGCDPETASVPDGWTVVQVGDLVHRGPDSPGVVALVDRFRRGPHGDRWVQLAGNHEAQYVRPGGPTFVWPEQLPDETVATIRRWWRDGWLRVAHDAAGVLCTHAGLTRGCWAALGAPPSAADAAAAVEALPKDARHSPLWRAGAMLGEPATGDAGPLWARAGDEVVGGWLGHRPPFPQAFGHSRLHFSDVGWLAPDAVREVTTLLESSGMSVSTLDGVGLWAVDPGHGTHPAAAYDALVVEPDATIHPLGRL